MFTSLSSIHTASEVTDRNPDPVKAGTGGLIFFSLLVAWAYWMNRLRPGQS